MKMKNFNTICIIIIAIVIFGICVILNYTNAKNDDNIKSDMKWSYKTNGKKENLGIIDLSKKISRNIQSTTNKVSPGTDGAFDLILDGSKTQLDYEIEMKIISKPTNLHLYSDKECTEELLEKNGYIYINGSIDENKPLAKTIYWKWPFETGESEEEIMKNDEIDTKEQGVEALLDISITGNKK